MASDFEIHVAWTRNSRRSLANVAQPLSWLAAEKAARLSLYEDALGLRTPSRGTYLYSMCPRESI
jgi:hypothetical protein